ncbi:putative RNA-binding protein, YhbY family [Formivibrio citricus]|uniref:Putative RNA-binding protein, YhbY family n=1 Tax=Formivibrio citricus TaxID=83765 RepID=A0A1I4VYG8_9NEIS|nr:ribosome assembly RNA-binding protein YhbY [Formivibrio citricus]SFN06273.1 putative RNA-binding protein, YhbY family [Formivibrio citricus]
MIELTPDQRRYLKSQAHHLNPVVMIGNNGLTDAVIREIAANLDAHELIKIRVLGDDRELREQFLQQICADLDAAPVQHIGKLLLVYRPGAEGKRKIVLPKAKK